MFLRYFSQWIWWTVNVWVGQEHPLESAVWPGQHQLILFIPLSSEGAHTREPRPDSCLGFQAEVLKSFQLFPLYSEAASATSTDARNLPQVTVLCRFLVANLTWSP
jgi:hypothetical protein